MQTVNDILVARGHRYGEFNSHAAITQAMKDLMAGRVDPIQTNWESLSDSQKEALEMVAHKIGRILNGDPSYIDSWADICGYSQLVVNELSGIALVEDTELGMGCK